MLLQHSAVWFISPLPRIQPLNSLSPAASFFHGPTSEAACLAMFIISSLGHKMAAISPNEPFPDQFSSMSKKALTSCLLCNTAIHYYCYHVQQLHCFFPHFVLYIFTVFTFWLWQSTCRNYGLRKKQTPCCLLLWMLGLNRCSCQQGDQRDIWNEEASCIGFESLQRLIVLFGASLGKAGGGIHFVVIHSQVGCILTKYLCTWQHQHHLYRTYYAGTILVELDFLTHSPILYCAQVI